MPKVTVMTPVYNGENYLREMMDSILAQTMRDFEWLIINDGSTDATEQIVNSFNDPRIRYYANDGNKGIAHSFNRAIELSTGDFLAVAEADDINHPRRLEIQTAYMLKNENVGLLSSRHNAFSDRPPAFKEISDPEKINSTAGENKIGMIFYGHSVRHPLTVYRKSVLEKHNIQYNSRYKISCDYDMFTRMSRVTDMVRLSCVLLNYRIHKNNVSRNIKANNGEANEICRKFFKREFGFDMRGKFLLESDKITHAEFSKSIDSVEHVLSHVGKHPEYDYKSLKMAAAHLAHKHWKAMVRAGLDNGQAFRLYRKTPLLRHIDAAKKTRIWVKGVAWHLGVKR